METRTFSSCPGIVWINTFLFVRRLDKIAKGAMSVDRFLDLKELYSGKKQLD